MQYAVEHHFDKYPLSEDELSAGEALRVVKCVRSSENDSLFWSVVYVSRNHDAQAKPAVSGVFTRAMKPLGTEELARSVYEISDDNVWMVHEYAINLPRNLRWFTVRCGTRRYRIDFTEHRRLTHEHYAEIRHAATDEEYQRWNSQHRKHQEAVFDPDGYRPLVSIITPAYKTPPHYLSVMIDSVCAQTYTHWEHVIVNASPEDTAMQEIFDNFIDPRIRIITCPENKGIAGNTNIGIAECKGDYVCFLDHDDLIEPDALAYYVREIQSDREVDLLYCDEDSIDENKNLSMPLFKPKMNPDLLYSNDYVIHWLMVSRHIIESTERSSSVVDGAQDYDLTLKAFTCARSIKHIPQVLYHWRIHSGSLNSNPGSKPYAQLAGQRAIENHFEMTDVPATVRQEEVPGTYRSEFYFEENYPSVLSLTGEGKSVSEINDLVLGSQEELLFFTNELLLCQEDDLRKLIGYFVRPEISVVSPRVLRKDGLVDYAGLIANPEGYLIPLSRFLLAEDEGYIGRSHRPYNSVIANAECFVLRISDFKDVGGFDVSYRTLEYALADMCMKLYFVGKGKRVVYTPFVKAAHSCHKSLLEKYMAAEATFDRDQFHQRYQEVFSSGDPSHNVNFDPESPYYRLKW